MSVIGSITSGTKVIIVDPSDLTIADTLGGWSQATKEPEQFTVSGTVFGSFSILDGNNTLLFVNDTDELRPNTGKSSAGKNVLTAKGDVEQWASPTILLSYVRYDILDTTGNVVTLYSKRLSGVWIIPATYYMKLDRGNGASCYDSGSVLISARTFLCNNNADLDYCRSYAKFDTAWTTASDCEDGYNYLYCPSGKTCGENGGCRAICEDDQKDSCVYTPQSSGQVAYSCKLDVQKRVSSEPLLQQTWFLLILLGIVVMIIIIFVIILIALIAFKHM